MGIQYICLCLGLMAGCGQVAVGQSHGGQPLQDLLISPERLIRHQKEIGLRDEQVQQIRTRLEKAAEQLHEVQQKANFATGRLAELLSADPIDEAAALKQLDQVLAIEKDQKRLHLRIMIQIRNQLTTEQRQRAATLKPSAKARDTLQQRLKAKLVQIEKAVQSQAAEGQPPFEAIGLMQKFPELMQNGHMQEAEALLDRAMTMLGLEQTDEGSKARRAGPLPKPLAEKITKLEHHIKQMQQKGEDISSLHNQMRKIAHLIQQDEIDEAEKRIDQAIKESKLQEPPDGEPKPRPISDPPALSKRLSPEAVRAEVAALKQEEVAWRKIEWKTCLLDGLKASREQHKPLMLWIFIDRPIDDERC